MFSIKCPKCKRRATTAPVDSKAANDDETHLSFVAPEGFRKIQVGWSSSELQLFCVICGVAALRD